MRQDMTGKSGHAMVLRKRKREEACAASSIPIVRTPPADLLLEIAGRSAPGALVRFAATCKHLRHEIGSPSFILRLRLPCILAYMRTSANKRFTLLHPASPAVVSICNDKLFPFFSRRAGSLFRKYTIVTSRRGLVLLKHDSELCVYDLMRGSKTFLARPPDIKCITILSYRQYVLLTAADGIQCPFLLLVFDFDGWGINVRCASSCGAWGSATNLSKDCMPWWLIKRNRDPAILHGSMIHWLVSHDKPILWYDLGKRKLGCMKLPPTNCNIEQIHLVTSSDGKLLKLLAINEFMLSVWLQLPISTPGDSGWSLETVIDMEEKLRTLHPDIPHEGLDEPIVFDDSVKRSGNVVLLQVPSPYYDNTITVFDLETKDAHMQECRYGSVLLEIDLPSHLQNMKIFS